MSLEDFLAEHPVDRERVDAHKRRLLAEIEACRDDRSEEDDDPRR